MAEEQALWYVVHTYSGYENKVATDLQKTAANKGLTDLIQDVMVPVEESTEIKNGKEHVVQHKIFPGYVLVKMVKTTETWYVVRNTRGVTGFVGPGSEPIPLTDEEFVRMTHTHGTVRSDLEKGDKVRINEGGLGNASGIVEEVIPEQKKVKVAVRYSTVSILLRLTYRRWKSYNSIFKKDKIRSHPVLQTVRPVRTWEEQFVPHHHLF
jgi:transcriptional antiterminator NusG